MTHPILRSRLWRILLGTALATSAAVAAAQSTSWNYKSYVRDKVSGKYDKEKFHTSTITLTEKDGKATFRMVTPAGRDLCASASEMPADVERAADTTTITVTPQVAGCEPFRYVIKNDGSGGVRMNRRGERWAPDGLDHDLTPAK